MRVVFTMRVPFGTAPCHRSQYFCEGLGVHNRLMCHVFILDGHGRVRWRFVEHISLAPCRLTQPVGPVLRSAHADPAEGETTALVEATRSLLAESAAPPRRG